MPRQSLVYCKQCGTEPTEPASTRSLRNNHGSYGLTHMNPITTPSMDVQLLAQEHRAIELLARDTNSTIAKVQEIFLSEYARLAPHAHITSFLPLLTCNRVRVILGGRHNANHRTAKP